MILQTENLILKSHTMDNYAKIKQWMNDPELLYFDDDEPEPIIPKNDEQLAQTMKRLIESPPEAKKDIIHFAIHKKNDNSIIGYCMIAFIDNYHKKCKVGFVIGEKEEWGKGYGKEMLKGLVLYCFADLKLNRIGAEVYSHNERSIKLLENIGFVREGVIRQSVLKRGKYVEEYIYGLLKEEWEEI